MLNNINFSRLSFKGFNTIEKSNGQTTKSTVISTPERRQNKGLSKHQDLMETTNKINEVQYAIMQKRAENPDADVSEYFSQLGTLYSHQNTLKQEIEEGIKRTFEGK